MGTKLIELADGTLVEVEVSSGQPEQISGGVFEKVESTLKKVEPILISIGEPIAAAWKKLSEEVHAEGIEVEVNLGFEAEGNIYITRSGVNANLTVKMTFKPMG